MTTLELIETADVALPAVDRETVAAWPAHFLDKPPTTGSDELCRAAIERLAASNWRAEGSLHAVIDLIDETPHDAETLPPQTAGIAYLETERMLRAEVEQFAQAFFQIEPAERRNRWNDLWLPTERFPAVFERLRRLDPGLDAVIPTTGLDDRLRDLLTTAAAWFTARPSDRADSRRRFGDLLPSEAAERLETLHRLRAAAPQLMLLVGGLLDDLTIPARGFAAVPFRPRWSARTTPASEYAVVTSNSRTSGGNSGGGWRGFLSVAGVMVTLQVLRLIFGATDSSSHRYSPPKTTSQVEAEKILKELQRLQHDRVELIPPTTPMTMPPTITTTLPALTMTFPGLTGTTKSKPSSSKPATPAWATTPGTPGRSSFPSSPFGNDSEGLSAYERHLQLMEEQRRRMESMMPKFPSGSRSNIPRPWERDSIPDNMRPPSSPFRSQPSTSRRPGTLPGTPPAPSRPSVPTPGFPR